MSETKLRYRLSISGIDLDGRQSLLTERSYAPTSGTRVTGARGGGLPVSAEFLRRNICEKKR